MKTLGDLVREAAKRLAGRSSEGGPAHRSSAERSEGGALDAELLARHVLRWDRARWLADSRTEAAASFEPAFTALVERRAAGEPIAYITGTKEFWGLDFQVSPAVLIPRPETEVLVEEALKAIDASAGPEGPRHRVADACTGSGCVAVALAHARPSIHVIATDVSEAALHVAARNAERHEVGDRVAFTIASGLEGVDDVDLVVSNPPYVSREDAGRLMRDVVDFEPHLALFAGGDGLDVIRQLLADVARRTPPPLFMFEFGGNEAAVRSAVEASGLRLARVVPDLAGIPRVAIVDGHIER